MILADYNQVTERVKRYIGDDTSDDAIALIEDVTDTIAKIKEDTSIDWKKKYEDNDNEWRQKYIDRFENGAGGSGSDDDKGSSELEPNIPRFKTFDELFD